MQTTARFHKWLRTSTGKRFRGTIGHVGTSGLGSSSFIETRTTLNVLPNEPVQAGDLITDGDRRFLVGTHDIRSGKRVHKLFELTTYLSWKRPAAGVDEVTGLQKAAYLKDFGYIWCVMEIYGRQEVDRAMHNAIERTRIITGDPIQLNDQIDGRMVRRIYKLYGVTVAEIQ